MWEEGELPSTLVQTLGGVLPSLAKKGKSLEFSSPFIATSVSPRCDKTLPPHLPVGAESQVSGVLLPRWCGTSWDVYVIKELPLAVLVIRNSGLGRDWWWWSVCVWGICKKQQRYAT
ncbi:hypothetical protein CDAR_487561 [Caerostris darwini]|uniref:Uncharacterized protein n=1 Tax=Caerostris darwini TaxID=1538125 RepID=A0AAV4PTY6_9ARAC|nr:hypothetical protein CDAR_487561 [Caerostris darwini]